MATLTAGGVASNVPVRTGINCVISVTETYTFLAAQALNDVIQMVKIPSGATVLDVILSCDDIDSNGSPAVTLDVGDGSDTDRFIAVSTIGQTGGTARLGSGITDDTCHGYTYTADDTIDVLIHAAPATAVYSGKSISMTVLYTMQNNV